jgi:DNA gyrase/topoisomerase IV subunit B
MQWDSQKKTGEVSLVEASNMWEETENAATRTLMKVDVDDEENTHGPTSAESEVDFVESGRDLCHVG